MSDWPSSPLIRITSGSLRGVPLHEALAASVGPSATGAYFKYQIIQGPGVGSLIRRDDPDSGRILAWEDVLPVPAADLQTLRTEFRGANISERRLPALLQVTSTLEPPAPSPLDQAVARVEKLLEGPRTLLDTSPEQYLALLLGALATFKGVEYGPRPQAEQALATLVRICVQWLAETASPRSRYGEQGESGILAEVRAQVESDPDVGGFLAMTALAGAAADWIDRASESGTGPEELFVRLSEPVILIIAHYALALLAENSKGSE
jgi:hypothetical protein